MGLITIDYKDWTFSSDVELTKSAYKRIERGSADICICDNCRNFSTLRDSAYPDEVKKLFQDLGIDYKKEPEVSYFAKQGNGLHYYSGFFHFRGNYTGKDCCTALPGGGYNLNLTPITDVFKIGAHMDNSLSYFEDKESIVQIEFSVELPWALQSTEPT